MRSQLVSIVGLLVFTATGCLYHGGNPYGYYGPGPSVMPQQPWTGQPAGTYPSYNPYPTPVGSPYTPSNQPSMGQPTPMDPNPTDPNSPPNTFKGGDNNNPPSFSLPRTPAGGTVPEPTDPTDDTNPQSSNSPSLSPTSSTSRTSKTSDEPSTSFEDQTSSRLPRDFGNSSTDGAEPVFESPVKQVNHESDSDIPYGHSDRFDWLQGYVEYDEPTETWVVIYTDNPQPSDKMGGEATLADHPSLKNLRDGQIVRIEGAFDKSAKDSRKNPPFRISKLIKLQKQ